MVMKGCVSDCKEKSLSLAGYGYVMACCTTDGCNAANSMQMKFGFIVFSMIAALFFGKF